MLVCQARLFRDRDVTVDASFGGIPSTALICLSCTYMHIFVSGTFDSWPADQGYPG